MASFIDSFIVISFSRVCFLGSVFFSFFLFFFFGFFGSTTIDPIWQAVGIPKSRSLAEGSVGVSSAGTPHHVLDSVWTQDLLWSQGPRTGYASEPSPLSTSSSYQLCGDPWPFELLAPVWVWSGFCVLSFRAACLLFCTRPVEFARKDHQYY